MEYVFDWKLPKRILVTKVSGNVSLDDLRQFNTELVRYLDDGDAPVHIISIGDNLHNIPTNIMQIKTVLSFVQHPHLGWIIIVKEKSNHVTEFIISISSQATGMQFQQVKSMTHAIESLKQHDDTLSLKVP